jgi:hypothetical protein
MAQMNTDRRREARGISTRIHGRNVAKICVHLCHLWPPFFY